MKRLDIVVIDNRIDYDKNGRTMKLSQETAAIKILDKFGLSTCNPTHTPMEKGLQLKRDRNRTSNPYRDLLGSMMYQMLCATRKLFFQIFLHQKMVVIAFLSGISSANSSGIPLQFYQGLIRNVLWNSVGNFFNRFFYGFLQNKFCQGCLQKFHWQLFPGFLHWFLTGFF